MVYGTRRSNAIFTRAPFSQVPRIYVMFLNKCGLECEEDHPLSTTAYSIYIYIFSIFRGHPQPQGTRHAVVTGIHGWKLRNMFLMFQLPISTIRGTQSCLFLFYTVLSTALHLYLGLSIFLLPSGIPVSGVIPYSFCADGLTNQFHFIYFVCN